MLLKVDGLSTDQMLELVRFIGSDENKITVKEVREMPNMQAGDPIDEISRNGYRRAKDMATSIPCLVRIVSMKGNLVDGNGQDEEDTYDLVLEVPQFLFVFCIKQERGETPTSRTIAIPRRIMQGIQEILAKITPLRAEKTTK